MRQFMRHRLSRSVFLSLAIALIFSGPVASRATSPQRDDAHYQARLAEEVRHQLVMVPYLTVFDNLQYQVTGTEVTVMGQVTEPTVKTDALNALKRVEGITKVNDQIEVLPVSPMDDQIRLAQYRAIYGFPGLEKYAIGYLAPIHIIVKGGHVTLEGVVLNEADKNLTGIRAMGVPNVFSVTNNLQIASRK
jgi:hyperosmotically inducible protein